MGEDPLNDGRVLNRGDELHPPGTEHRNRTPRAGRDVADGTREPGVRALDVSQAEGDRQ